MFTDPRIPTILLADDGAPNPDDVLDVTQQISNNFVILAQIAGITHVANFGALPTLNNFNGRLAQTDNDGAIYHYNNGWIFLQDTKWQESFVPKVSSVGGAVILGTGGSTYCRYYRIGQKCHIAGWGYTGTSGFSGGLNSLLFSIPFKHTGFGSAGSWGTAVIGCRSEDHNCISRIDVNGSTVKIYALYKDSGETRIKAFGIQNCDAAANPNSGVPRFTNGYTWDASNPGYWNWDLEYWFDINQPIASG